MEQFYKLFKTLSYASYLYPAYANLCFLYNTFFSFFHVRHGSNVNSSYIGLHYKSCNFQKYGSAVIQYLPNLFLDLLRSPQKAMTQKEPKVALHCIALREFIAAHGFYSNIQNNDCLKGSINSSGFFFFRKLT